MWLKYLRMTTTPDIIIAVDGYSSTGKSTLAKKIASEFGLLYLDSGALYRGVTLYALEKGLISEDGQTDTEKLQSALENLDLHFVGTGNQCKTFMGERCIEDLIRTSRVSSYVSTVASLGFVREFVDSKLHEFGKKKGVVMDGRDIGTTVFPAAELKIFLTASPEVRAQRRLAEYQAKGEQTTLEEVLKGLEQRDWMDCHREISPLSKAEDAIELNNSTMTLEDEIRWTKDTIRQRLGIDWEA